MSGYTSAVLVGAALTSTAYSAYAGNKAGQDQRSAQRAAQAQAGADADAADQANNRLNQKRPDTAGALASAMMSGKAGASGTLLTGPQGIDPGALSLGKTTLLGG